MDIYEIADSIPAELAQVTLARILAELGVLVRSFQYDVRGQEIAVALVSDRC